MATEPGFEGASAENVVPGMWHFLLMTACSFGNPGHPYARADGLPPEDQLRPHLPADRVIARFGGRPVTAQLVFGIGELMMASERT
jgi:hypothetical protein